MKRYLPLLASLIFAPALAVAQPAAPAAPPVTTATTSSSGMMGNTDAAAGTDAERARALFEEGVAAYNDSRYADAIGKFLESHRIRRTSSVAMNLGVTLRAMGRLVEAREYFREFFELSSERMRAQYDAQIRGYLNEIAGRLATVHIVSASPSVYSLHVDDRVVAANDQGLIDVDPGNHTLLVEAVGFAPERIQLQLPERSKKEISFALTRLGGANNTTGPREGAPAQGVSAGAIVGIVAAVLVVGAGAGVLGWYLSTPLDPPPSNTNLTIDVSGR